MYKDKIIELCIFHIDEKDNRIENLQAVNDTYQGEIFKLEADIKELKADKDNEELKIAQDGIDDLNDVVKELQAENKHLILSNERRGEMVRELQAENKRLKNGFGHGVLVELEQVDELKEQVKELKVALENYQCGCKYPKELKADAEEYFHHNPQDEKIWYMLISPSDVDEDGVLDAHKDVGVDAVAEFDNYQGKISGDVFK
tara:strand:+ start:2301 stop:2906 length:606 start_codon:yes stop_codon:yes gene_type:complete